MLIKNLYDLPALKRFVDSRNQRGFTDSYTGTILARNLTAIDPQIFEKKYPELSFVNSGITADNTGGYVQRIQSLRLRGQGGFKTSGDQSGNRGKISLAGEDNTILVIERSAESDWSDTEIEQAAISNINLPSRYIEEHNKIYLREVDYIGYLGVPDKGTKGLLNYTGWTSAAATGAIGTLTARQMYDDIAGLIVAQHNAVNNTPEYMATNVDMPIYALNTLAVTILDSAAGAASVLSALKSSFPGVQFRATFRADDAGGTGVSHTIAYSTNTEAMKMRIPQPLKIGEIIKRGSFDFHVDSKYRIAGLDVLEDTAAYILTGL